MDEIRGAKDEYTKPTVVDHGDLQELTAKGGGASSDAPTGSPVVPSPVFSTP